MINKFYHHPLLSPPSCLKSGIIIVIRVAESFSSSAAGVVSIKTQIYRIIYKYDTPVKVNSKCNGIATLNKTEKK